MADIINSFVARKNKSEYDFYPTPPIAVEALLKFEEFQGEIWECACGDGAISEVLKKHGHKVYSSDIVDRGYGENRSLDFLDESRAGKIRTYNIVTNPPYKYAQEFVEKSLERTDYKVCMFLRLSFLESHARYKLFKNTPLKHVYVFSNRLSLYQDNIKKGKGGSMFTYAWYVWDKQYTGEPIIRWLYTGKKDKERSYINEKSA